MAGKSTELLAGAEAIRDRVATPLGDIAELQAVFDEVKAICEQLRSIPRDEIGQVHAVLDVVREIRAACDRQRPRLEAEHAQSAKVALRLLDDIGRQTIDGRPAEPRDLERLLTTGPAAFRERAEAMIAELHGDVLAAVMVGRRDAL